jgi:hypothetical protein
VGYFDPQGSVEKRQASLAIMFPNNNERTGNLMKLEKTAAIAEIVSSIAIVLTLIYLAI